MEDMEFDFFKELVLLANIISSETYACRDAVIKPCVEVQVNEEKKYSNYSNEFKFPDCNCSTCEQLATAELLPSKGYVLCRKNREMGQHVQLPTTKKKKGRRRRREYKLPMHH